MADGETAALYDLEFHLVFQFLLRSQFKLLLFVFCHKVEIK